MKSALRPIHVLFLLFEICVFGDEVKAETVSVIEGESVTLHTGVTGIQRYDVIDWKLNGSRIAKISGDSSRSDGIFRDRLKLDHQTGDITITNIKTTDSGEYKLKITSTVSSDTTFSVSVVPGVDEVKSVSVTVGDSVTLNSGNNIQRDDVIEWRFADLNSSIAEHNRKTVNSTSDGPDGIFRHRLQLDYSTGSLIIRNITNHHSGLYEAAIRKSSSGHTIHQSYSVTAIGKRKSALSVIKGESVPLHAGLTEIHTDDLMLWMFEETVITEINKAQNRFSTYDDVLDERFRDRLKLDEKTGNLTISDTRTEDSGLYELKISSSRFTINKRITVTVSGPSRGEIAGIVIGLLLLCAAAAAVAGVIYHRHKISELKEWIHKGRILSVKEGEPITLTPDDTKVHKDDKLVWIFRCASIAVRQRAAQSFDLPDERFEGRLELNDQTGSLTITDTRTTDTGVYELAIISSRKSSIKRFRVCVFAGTNDIEPLSVMEGESVTLESGVTDTQTVYEILWACGLYIPLAKITGGNKKFLPLVDKIFKGRLELDHKTGSLIINNIKPTDAGIYMLRKMVAENTISKFFSVSVSESTDNRNKPKMESVTKNNPEEMSLKSVETFPDSRL